MAAQQKPEILDEGQVGEMVGLSRFTMYMKRRQGTGPAFIRLGNRIRYRRGDVEAWLDANRCGGEERHA